MKRVPPWLIFLPVLGAAAALRLSGLVPAGAAHPLLQGIAGVLAVLSIGLGIWSVQALLRFDGQTPVSFGPFRFSRHPMYLAMFGVLAATGLVTSEWVLLGALPVLVVLVDRLVVGPEEAELRQVFGEAYERYAHSVRRWLGTYRTGASGRTGKGT